MAGHGPAPGANPNRKPAGQRRHRGKVVEFDDLPAEGYQGEFPPLPAGYSVKVVTEDGHDFQEREFLPRTAEWYETWARSPMAVRFTSVDWMRLQDIAPLKDRYYRESSKDLAAELRLQESLFGATVLDRQRLNLKVAAEPKPEPITLAAVIPLQIEDPRAAKAS